MYDVCKQRRILPTAVTSGFEARRIELIGDQRVLKILSRRFKPRIGLEVGETAPLDQLEYSIWR